MIKPNKTKIWLFVIPLLLFIGLLVMLANRLGKPTEIVSHTAIGRDLPTFNLPLLADTRTISNQDLPRTPFILNIWGSWCPTCRIEHPFLMTLHGQGVPMVGVNYKDEMADALAYLKQHQDPFLYSIYDYQGSLAMDLGLTGAPESFVIDQAGKVRLHIVGELSEQNWTNNVKPCLDVLNQPNATIDEQNQLCRL